CWYELDVYQHRKCDWPCHRRDIVRYQYGLFFLFCYSSIGSGNRDDVCMEGSWSRNGKSGVMFRVRCDTLGIVGKKVIDTEFVFDNFKEAKKLLTSYFE